MTASRRARSAADLLRLRLASQGLSAARHTRARDVVERLGAVQAQDFAAARWSLGLRMIDATDADVVAAHDAGEILRTHVLRPTWHFVTAEDIRWMLELTAPRVRRAVSSSNRRLGIDGALLRKTNRIIAQALEEGHRTRQELKARLRAEGVDTDTQRLAHIVMDAELEGLICSGPLRGKQSTYALLDERAPPVRARTREEAAAELLVRYLGGHGPAQLQDFAWWSGLTMGEARLALEGVAPRLESIEVSGRTHWRVPGTRAGSPPPALLLSIFDEYTIAYRDRSDLGDGRNLERMLAMGSALTSVVVLDGRVAGTWKRTITTRRVTVSLAPFQEPGAAHRAALEAQVRRLGAFLGLEAVVTSGA